MISIKRFLEQRFSGPMPDREMLQAALETVRLVLGSMPMRVVRGPEAAFDAFVRSCRKLSQRMDSADTPLELLAVAGEIVDATEEYAVRTNEYFREQGEQMQAILRMLTEALAEFSGRSDSSVARLHDIEKKIERASELDDIKALRVNLQICLASLREASAEEKKGANAALQHLRSELDQAQQRMDAAATAQNEIEAGTTDLNVAWTAGSYVAAFKLQHAEHIASRFGDSVRRDMLAVVMKSLKTVLGPADRIVRWKGNSLVVFLSSKWGVKGVRARLSDAVSSTRQQYINVGTRSAMLSVGVDWTVFPQSQYPSLNAALAEVDAFLAGEVRKEPSWSATA